MPEKLGAVKGAVVRRAGASLTPRALTMPTLGSLALDLLCSQQNCPNILFFPLSGADI